MHHTACSAALAQKDETHLRMVECCYFFTELRHFFGGLFKSLSDVLSLPPKGTPSTLKPLLSSRMSTCETSARWGKVLGSGHVEDTSTHFRKFNSRPKETPKLQAQKEQAAPGYRRMDTFDRAKKSTRSVS